jgi:hypothetical protein
MTTVSGAMERANTAVRFLSPQQSWARYAINNNLSFRTYALGFELLTNPDTGGTWLIRGFDALLAHVGKL